MKNSNNKNNSIVVDAYRDGEDCRETFFTVYAGHRVILAPQSLNSVYTRRHIEEVAKRKFGEDVKIEFPEWMETE